MKPNSIRVCHLMKDLYSVWWWWCCCCCCASLIWYRAVKAELTCKTYEIWENGSNIHREWTTQRIICCTGAYTSRFKCLISWNKTHMSICIWHHNSNSSGGSSTLLNIRAKRSIPWSECLFLYTQQNQHMCAQQAEYIAHTDVRVLLFNRKM